MIYSYKCNKCEHEFDKDQRLLDAELVICEKCSADASRVISAPPTFILKGSGWAKDGYK